MTCAGRASARACAAYNLGFTARRSASRRKRDSIAAGERPERSPLLREKRHGQAEAGAIADVELARGVENGAQEKTGVGMRWGLSRPRRRSSIASLALRGDELGVARRGPRGRQIERRQRRSFRQVTRYRQGLGGRPVQERVELGLRGAPGRSRQVELGLRPGPPQVGLHHVEPRGGALVEPRLGHLARTRSATSCIDWVRTAASSAASRP